MKVLFCLFVFILCLIITGAEDKTQIKTETKKIEDKISPLKVGKTFSQRKRPTEKRDEEILPRKEEKKN